MWRSVIPSGETGKDRDKDSAGTGGEPVVQRGGRNGTDTDMLTEWRKGSVRDGE